jgi:phosphorylcholine metabolism protein LicD
MNNLIILFCIIALIIFILQNIVIRNMIINEYKVTENKRMLAMGGINNQHYIPFSKHYNMFQLLKVLTKILDDNNIDYSLSCGTLLGYYRHNNGFIPWDDDIDILIIEKDLNKLKKVMNEFILNSETKYYFDLMYNFKSYIFSTSPINMKVYNSLFIDIYIYNNNDNVSIYKCSNIAALNEYYTDKELFPLKDGSFKLYLPDGKIYEEIPVKLPNNPFPSLKRLYNNWENKQPCAPHSIYNRFIFNNYISMPTKDQITSTYRSFFKK